MLAQTVLRDPDVAAISSHFIRTFPPMIGSRIALYITFLREPERHFLSYLTYIKKVFRNLADPELLRCLPREVPEMDLRAMAHWILTRDAAIPFKENYQVNFFAEHVWSQASGWALPRSEYGVRRWDADLFSRYKLVRLDLARVVLGNFFFVGLVERIDASVEHLREKCAALGLALARTRVGRENLSSELLRDLSWVHPGDSVGKLPFESLQEDFELYRWAKQRCERAMTGSVPLAIRWDRNLVTPVPCGDGATRVYLVIHGMKRLVVDPRRIPELPAISSEVHPISEWELAEIPPGAPI